MARSNNAPMLAEPAVKRLIKKHLTAIGAYWWMPPAGPFGKVSFPDFVGCWEGFFFAIEAKGRQKNKDGKATAAQLLVGRQIMAAGGAWFLIDHYNVHEIAEIMKKEGIGR